VPDLEPTVVELDLRCRGGPVPPRGGGSGVVWWSAACGDARAPRRGRRCDSRRGAQHSAVRVSAKAGPPCRGGSGAAPLRGGGSGVVTWVGEEAAEKS
jgi:hypothetical protein